MIRNIIRSKSTNVAKNIVVQETLLKRNKSKSIANPWTGQKAAHSDDFAFEAAIYKFDREGC